MSLSYMIRAACVAALLIAGPAQAGEILQQILARGTLRVAVIPSLPPFSSMTPSGELQGYDIDIAKRLATAMGLKAEFVPTDSAGRVADLQTHKADVTISDIARSVQRSLTIAFSEPYSISYGQLVVRADSPAKTMLDLNDAKYKISINRGGFVEQGVAAALPKATLVRFNANADTLNALTSGQVDAMGQEGLYDLGVVKDYPGKFRILPGSFSRSETSVAMPAGDPDLLRVINLWVEQFNASGDNAVLFKHWFGFDKPVMQTPY